MLGTYENEAWFCLALAVLLLCLSHIRGVGVVGYDNVVSSYVKEHPPTTRAEAARVVTSGLALAFVLGFVAFIVMIGAGLAWAANKFSWFVF